MAVKIRLKRMGKIRAPYYRIVVADSRTKRDGRVIEEIGKYHPKEDPSFIEVDSERALYWLGVGAQPSEPVAAILKVTGDWQAFKGEAAPAPMKVAEARPDKSELFNEALKESLGEPKTEAVTGRRPSAKKAASAEVPAKPADEPAASGSAKPADEPPASDTAMPADEPATAESTPAVDEPVTGVESSAVGTPEEETPVSETSPVGEAAAEEAPTDDAPADTEASAARPTGDSPAEA